MELKAPNIKVYVNDFPAEVSNELEDVFKELFVKFSISNGALTMVILRIQAPNDSDNWEFEIRPWLRKFRLKDEDDQKYFVGQVKQFVNEQFEKQKDAWEASSKRTTQDPNASCACPGDQKTDFSKKSEFGVSYCKEDKNLAFTSTKVQNLEANQNYHTMLAKTPLYNSADPSKTFVFKSTQSLRPSLNSQEEP